MCLFHPQAERARWLGRDDTSILCGWSSSSTDSDVEEVEGGDEPPKKKKRQEVNKEGLKKQALTALRQIKLGLIQQTEGITALESVCNDTPLNLLPGLLASTQEQFGAASYAAVKMEKVEPSTSTASTSSTPAKVKEEGSSGSAPSTPSKEVKAIWVSKSSYKCSECGVSFGSRNGCQAHIIKVHTGLHLFCPFCDWSTANRDALNRHVKQQHDMEEEDD